MGTALCMLLASALGAQAGDFTFEGTRASARQAAAAAMMSVGPMPLAAPMEEVVGQLRLDVEDRARDHGTTYGDQGHLEVEVRRGADRYLLTLVSTGFPPGGTPDERAMRSPVGAVGGGVILGRPLPLGAGLMFAAPVVAADIAMWGVGELRMNGRLVTDRAFVHLVATTTGVLADDRTGRVLPRPRPRDGEVHLFVAQLPRNVFPSGALHVAFDEVELNVAGTPLATAAFIPAEGRPELGAQLATTTSGGEGGMGGSGFLGGAPAGGANVQTYAGAAGLVGGGAASSSDQAALVPGASFGAAAIPVPGGAAFGTFSTGSRGDQGTGDGLPTNAGISPGLTGTAGSTAFGTGRFSGSVSPPFPGAAVVLPQAPGTAATVIGTATGGSGGAASSQQGGQASDLSDVNGASGLLFRSDFSATGTGTQDPGARGSGNVFGFDAAAIANQFPPVTPGGPPRPPVMNSGPAIPLPSTPTPLNAAPLPAPSAGPGPASGGGVNGGTGGGNGTAGVPGFGQQQQSSPLVIPGPSGLPVGSVQGR